MNCKVCGRELRPIQAEIERGRVRCGRCESVYHWPSGEPFSMRARRTNIPKAYYRETAELPPVNPRHVEKFGAYRRRNTAS